MNKNLIAAHVRYGMATEQELASLSRDDLLAMKSCEDNPHFRFSDDLVPAEKAAGDLGEREHEHIFSSERRDSMGDIILVGGWDLERVKNALPVFYAHESREIPVGVVKRAWKGKLPDNAAKTDQRTSDKALLGKYGIHAKDFYGEDNVFGQKAEAVQALLEARAIRGGSVGFMPVETYYPKSEDEAKELGLGDWGVLFRKQSLLEWSITPIPANPDAQKLKSAAQESRAAGTTVLKGLVDAGQLLPDAAEALIDELFTEKAFAFLKGEDKTVVSMEGIDLDALLDEPAGEEKAAEPEPEGDGAVELEERDGEAATPEPRVTRDTDLGILAETLKQVTETVARLTEASVATAASMQHILERFEEHERTASKGTKGGQSTAELADVENPGRSGPSRSEDPQEFAESVMRDVLAQLQSDGAQTKTDDDRDSRQGQGG